MIKTKVAFFGGPANQGNLKSFQNALIGWKKATFVLIMQTGYMCPGYR